MVQLATWAKLLPEGAAAMERAEGKMLTHVQPVTFLKHHFSPGIYVREIWMPKGAIILGHRHRTAHLNVILAGSCLVRLDEGVQRFVAPYTVLSGVGVRKALYILEDCIIQTIHANPTDERDLEKLEEMFVDKSETYKKHEAARIAREFAPLIP